MSFLILFSAALAQGVVFFGDNTPCRVTADNNDIRTMLNSDGLPEAVGAWGVARDQLATYTWDNSQLVSVSKPGRQQPTLAVTWDDAGRPLQMDRDGRQIIGFTYADGKTLAQTGPIALPTPWTSPVGRTLDTTTIFPMTMGFVGEGKAQKDGDWEAEFQYDEGGRLTVLHLAYGGADEAWYQWYYDEKGRLTRQRFMRGRNQSFDIDYQWEDDRVSAAVGIVKDDAVREVFEYNEAGQLVKRGRTTLRLAEKKYEDGRYFVVRMGSVLGEQTWSYEYECAEPVAQVVVSEPAPAVVASPPAPVPAGGFTGDIVSRKAGLVVVRLTEGTPPPVDASGILAKYFEKQLFGSTITGWLDIAAVEVEGSSPKEIRLRITEDLSTVVVNGKQVDHFKKGQRVKLVLDEP
jgi:YD repeat-containing protein